MKKLLTILITFLLIIGIYYGFNSQKINVVFLSDSIMNNSFNYYNYSDYIEDYLVQKKKLANFNNNFNNQEIKILTKDIKNNRTIKTDKEYYLKKILRESDYVIVSVGMNELSKNYDKYNMINNYDYFNRMFSNIEKLIIELKKYTPNHIIYLGYYNPTNYYDSKVDELFYYMDTKLNRLMMNNNVIYIDVYELIKGNNYKNIKSPSLLNTNAHKMIASIIEFYLN